MMMMMMIRWSRMMIRWRMMIRRRMLITKIMYLLKIEYLLNRGEDSSGGSDGESSLGFSAVKRKAPSVGQSNANNNNDTSKDAIGLLSFG